MQRQIPPFHRYAQVSGTGSRHWRETLKRWHRPPQPKKWHWPREKYRCDALETDARGGRSVSRRPQAGVATRGSSGFRLQSGWRQYASDHLCNVLCLPYKWPPTSVTAKRARRCGWTPRRDRGTAMHAPATGLIAASACHWCETMAYVLRLAHAAGRKKTRDGTAA